MEIKASFLNSIPWKRTLLGLIILIIIGFFVGFAFVGLIIAKSIKFIFILAIALFSLLFKKKRTLISFSDNGFLFQCKDMEYQVFEFEKNLVKTIEYSKEEKNNSKKKPLPEKFKKFDHFLIVTSTSFEDTLDENNEIFQKETNSSEVLILNNFSKKEITSILEAFEQYGYFLKK